MSRSKTILRSLPYRRINNNFLGQTNVRSLGTSTDAPTAAPTGGGIGQRFLVTAEVTVSKLFPAGFGWQYGSIIAGDMGFKAADAGFAVVTGLGDMAGVFLGHTIFYALKSMVSSKVSVSQEIQTGFFLGSAAFCSGAAWQPVVNFLQLTNAPFVQVAGCTWVACGLAFFGGLRLFRIIYSPILSIDGNNYNNLKNDASLSLAIGGGSSAFVGTDVAYLSGEGNFLRPIVGVEPDMSAIEGCIRAGS